MPGVLNLYTFKIQDRDEREKERESAMSNWK